MFGWWMGSMHINNERLLNIIFVGVQSGNSEKVSAESSSSPPSSSNDFVEYFPGSVVGI